MYFKYTRRLKFIYLRLFRPYVYLKISVTVENFILTSHPLLVPKTSTTVEPNDSRGRMDTLQNVLRIRSQRGRHLTPYKIRGKIPPSNPNYTLVLCCVCYS